MYDKLEGTLCKKVENIHLLCQKYMQTTNCDIHLIDAGTYNYYSVHVLYLMLRSHVRAIPFLLQSYSSPVVSQLCCTVPPRSYILSDYTLGALSNSSAQCPVRLSPLEP